MPLAFEVHAQFSLVHILNVIRLNASSSSTHHVFIVVKACGLNERTVYVRRRAVFRSQVYTVPGNVFHHAAFHRVRHPSPTLF